MTLAPRLIAILVAVALLAFLVIFGPSMCSAYFAEKQARKIEGGQSEATLDSVDEANRTAAEIDALEQTIEGETKDLADEVRNAPAGDSNDAATRAACKLKAYRNTPRCVKMVNPVTGE